MPQLSFHAPFGALTLSEEDGALVSLDWGWGRDQDETPLLARARDLLEGYFDGKVTEFALPMQPFGTPYRRRVWEMLQHIPYGRTVTYGQIAAEIGGSPRSVGGAVGANPLPILIPCHRVVGHHGFGGYTGGNGLEDKIFLLRLEGFQPAASNRVFDARQM